MSVVDFAEISTESYDGTWTTSPCSKCQHVLPLFQLWRCDAKTHCTGADHCHACKPCYRFVDTKQDFCNDCLNAAYPNHTGIQVGNESVPRFMPVSVTRSTPLTGQLCSPVVTVTTESPLVYHARKSLDKISDFLKSFATVETTGGKRYAVCTRCEKELPDTKLWECNAFVCCDQGFRCFSCDTPCYMENGLGNLSDPCCKACLEMEYQDIPYTLVKSTFNRNKIFKVSRKPAIVVTEIHEDTLQIPDLNLPTGLSVNFPLPPMDSDVESGNVIITTPTVSELNANCGFLIQTVGPNKFVAVKGRTLELFELLLYVVRLETIVCPDPRLPELKKMLLSVIRNDDLFYSVARGLQQKLSSTTTTPPLPSILTLRSTLLLRHCVQRFAIVKKLQELLPELFIQGVFYVFYKFADGKSDNTVVTQDIHWLDIVNAAGNNPTGFPCQQDERPALEQEMEFDDKRWEYFGQVDFGREKLKRNSPEKRSTRSASKRVRFRE